jgi:glutamate dehydrogenase (NAD(P)+)
MCKILGVKEGLVGKTFSVQGFGNVGYWASKFFVEAGAKLVGVAEWDGSIFNPNGINPDELLEYKERNKHKTVKGYPGSETYLDDSAIYQPVDFFIPAAL